ncbi:bidirectional sugar transporter NEC1-like isoform X1 [Primulina huaijiensis]|uniref:bidirectional sugar transporter NEC1-like isoform X1 n=1 Tax=Primulina huaijiensis TaxID=1492673 RepID=UPI003CC70486
MAISSAHHLACAFGILGNIVSFLVYLSPAPTFYRIWKKKSTEGFQSFPYSVALFSATLYLYYAYLKQNVLILITINSIGCVFEIFYLTIFMIYATKESKVFACKQLLLINFMSLGLIIGGTSLLSNGDNRVRIVGWICAAFSVSVFAAPLSIMRQVIRTKSVEFMPFSLSFFLTLCAVMWFFYGLLIKDYYIAAPNILGFSFGIMQMILYMVYKNRKQQIQPQEAKIHDLNTIKELNKAQENSMDVETSNGHDLEIIVIDHHGDEIPGALVIRSKEPTN